MRGVIYEESDKAGANVSRSLSLFLSFFLVLSFGICWKAAVASVLSVLLECRRGDEARGD